MYVCVYKDCVIYVVVQPAVLLRSYHQNNHYVNYDRNFVINSVLDTDQWLKQTDRIKNLKYVVEIDRFASTRRYETPKTQT